MATFNLKQHKTSDKASEYFRKLDNGLDLEKYKLDKYKDLFMLSSFQTMHDADQAYHYIYQLCAENAWSKETLVRCLDEEVLLPAKHPECFDHVIYRQQLLKAINEIKKQLAGGSLDYLYQ